MIRLLFVRHGESEANVLKVFSNRGWKHPLTENGRQQVEQFAENLKSHGVVAIYTSPLRRAVESAELLGARLRVAFEIEPALVEYDVGVYEGRRVAEGGHALDAVERRWLEGDHGARLPGGESCEDIRMRFVPFIGRLIGQFREHDHGAVVLVGHGGTYRQALPAVLRNVSPAFAAAHGLANTAWVEAVLRGNALHCMHWMECVPG